MKLDVQMKQDVHLNFFVIIQWKRRNLKDITKQVLNSDATSTHPNQTQRRERTELATSHPPVPYSPPLPTRKWSDSQR
jgi:hypothetical protein